MAKLYKRGLVVGKYFPFTLGHSLVIDTALAHCEHVVALVCEHKSQHLSGSLRRSWIEATHPKVEVRVIPDSVPSDDTTGWAKYTQQVLGYSPDAVFTSEDYGPPYAALMGADHIMVDRAREKVPISASRVRYSPLAAWEYLPPVVQQYYLKRICLLGAESTGKTTMAKALAQQLPQRLYPELTQYQNTVWVPEYGRSYAEGKVYLDTYSQGWTSDEFVHIAEMQMQLAQRLEPHSRLFQIQDTDALATHVWHWRYMGHYHHVLRDMVIRRPADLYLLTAPDVPFEQDGTRDGEHIRLEMHQEFVKVLDAGGYRYVILTGSHEQREIQAIRAIQAVWPQRSEW